MTGGGGESARKPGQELMLVPAATSRLNTYCHSSHLGVWCPSQPPTVNWFTDNKVVVWEVMGRREGDGPKELGFSGGLVAAILGERRSCGGVNLEARRLFWAGTVEGGRNGLQKLHRQSVKWGGEGAEGGSQHQEWSMITQRTEATKQLAMKHAKTNFLGGMSRGCFPSNLSAVSSETKI